MDGIARNGVAVGRRDFGKGEFAELVPFKMWRRRCEETPNWNDVAVSVVYGIVLRVCEGPLGGGSSAKGRNNLSFLPISSSDSHVAQTGFLRRQRLTWEASYNME